MNRRCFGALVAAATVVIGGCSGQLKERELEHVAKDWCMTIRASQVVPVYPLTQDIQPGDVFLVQTPIDEQQRVYAQRGFLPLDNHIARLTPQGYEAFYQSSFGVGGASSRLPKHWMKPSTGNAWDGAPQAGFPSYSVSVRSGGGFNAALPISGVPVGLSLLGSDAADISVTIDKARTYGVDMISLNRDVTDWLGQPGVAGFLSSFASTKDRKNYVRVVSRVYITGRLIVNLTASSTSSAGLSAGVPKPVELLTSTPGNDTSKGSAESYKSGIATLNTMLAATLEKAGKAAEGIAPGATLKVVAASARSITMAEDFIDQPLVIGYLGFDYQVLADGTLGPPAPTFSVLERLDRPQEGAFLTADETTIAIAQRRIAELPRSEDRFHTAAQNLGPEFKSRYDAALAALPADTASPAKQAFRSALVDFLSDPASSSVRRQWIIGVLSSTATLSESALASPPARRAP